MRHTPRRRIFALLLVTLLAAAPALPALAAPSQATAPTILQRIEAWLPWFARDTPKSATAASGTLPDWDPNGLDTAPQPVPAGPNATTNQTPPNGSGETLPDWDPDG